MELDKIITLIKTVSDSNLTQFSLEEGNLKISMKTDKQTKVISAPVMPLPTAGESVPSAVISAAEEVQKAEALVGGETEPEGNVVKSPLVGTLPKSTIFNSIRNQKGRSKTPGYCKRTDKTGTGSA